MGRRTSHPRASILLWRSEPLPAHSRVAAIVLDIEGTTTPISFVFDRLFPYARSHLAQWMREAQGTEPFREIVALLSREHSEEREAADSPPPLSSEEGEGGMESLQRYVLWLMDRDRKSTGLKKLQGEIWKAGYASGELRGEVFPDVAPALRSWQAAGKKVAIYSSGSVLAQKQIFGHSVGGDLTPLINNYFDTSVGAKRDTASYLKIASALQLSPTEVLFVSDVLPELTAADAAGMQVALAARPGNSPVGECPYPRVESLAELVQVSA